MQFHTVELIHKGTNYCLPYQLIKDITRIDKKDDKATAFINFPSCWWAGLTRISFGRLYVQIMCKLKRVPEAKTAETLVCIGGSTRVRTADPLLVRQIHYIYLYVNNFLYYILKPM